MALAILLGAVGAIIICACFGTLLAKIKTLQEELKQERNTNGQLINEIRNLAAENDNLKYRLDAVSSRLLNTLKQKNTYQRKGKKLSYAVTKLNHCQRLIQKDVKFLKRKLELKNSNGGMNLTEENNDLKQRLDAESSQLHKTRKQKNLYKRKYKKLSYAVTKLNYSQRLIQKNVKVLKMKLKLKKPNGGIYNLLGWVYGRDLDDILVSAKRCLYMFYLNIELRAVQQNNLYKRKCKKLSYAVTKLNYSQRLNQKDVKFLKRKLKLKKSNGKMLEPTARARSLFSPLKFPTKDTSLVSLVLAEQPLVMELPLVSPASCKIRWVREFKNGRTDVHDEPRAGRPSVSDETIAKVEAEMLEDRRVTVRKLCDLVPDVSKTTIDKILREHLGYSKNKRRETLTKGVRFHHDNARPHTAHQTTVLIEEFEWELVSHPPHVAPSDFHLFPKLKKNLGGTQFQDDDELKEAVLGFLRGQAAEFFDSGFHKYNLLGWVYGRDLDDILVSAKSCLYKFYLNIELREVQEAAYQSLEMKSSNFTFDTGIKWWNKELEQKKKYVHYEAAYQSLEVKSSNFTFDTGIKWWNKELEQKKKYFHYAKIIMRIIQKDVRFLKKKLKKPNDRMFASFHELKDKMFQILNFAFDSFMNFNASDFFGAVKRGIWTLALHLRAIPDMAKKESASVKRRLNEWKANAAPKFEMFLDVFR
ncbi:hypothetical protein LAZ67_14001524 [Cordylochernes scorpioides]|uniref:Transposase Tc1-like domain-containing protein n=1 Tax=Cordylochernes scorpioides TaxID=51811 RepID=A0ABY6L6Z0_9ARAC|nr:hypothetical protein LAZ67_14001524 [Cordylochernes scorpioides]